jgi:chromosome segregation ATPase
MRLEQELKIRIDIEIQLRNATENIRILTEQKDKLKKDLDTASDYLLEQDEKVYKAN